MSYFHTYVSYFNPNQSRKQGVMNKIQSRNSRQRYKKKQKSSNYKQ